MHPIQIAILDDHQIIIDGLKLLLERETNFEVIYNNTNGLNFLAHLQAHYCKPDVIIMDLMMPVIDGYEMAIQLNELYPAIKIIMLSMNTQADLVYKLVEFTAIKGYLPKTSNKSELLNAIQTVHKGSHYFSASILKELESYKIKIIEKDQLMLTPREIEIITLIAKGKSTKEMAVNLFLSEHTINTHRKNILKKTNTHNAASLIEVATRLQLIDANYGNI